MELWLEDVRIRVLRLLDGLELHRATTKVVTTGLLLVHLCC